MNVCNPREAWDDKVLYDKQAVELGKMFQDNYYQYTGEGITDYTEFGPQI